MAKSNKFTCLFCQTEVEVTPELVEWTCPKCDTDWAIIHFIVPPEWGEPGKGNK